MWSKLKKVFYFLCVLVFAGGIYTNFLDPYYGGKLSTQSRSDLKLGKHLYKRNNCIACHGEEGLNPIEGYPYIGGQPQEYLIQQIKDIRDGNRDNGATSLMKSTVQALSDEDIALISIYLSQAK